MEAIKNEIEKVTQRIGWEQDRLDLAVIRFKEYAAKADSYGIDTFVPGMVREVSESRTRLEALYEQKAMLEYLLKQNQ